MKIGMALTAAALVVSSSAAGAASMTVQRPDGRTVGDLLKPALGSRRVGGSGVRRPQAISLDHGVSAFLFQGAGSLAGQNGTFFHSDAMVANYRNASQTVAVGFLRQGLDNSNEPLQYFTIGANQVVALDDFVAATLHTSGFGAVVVIGVDANHDTDLQASLDGQSRIWTFQPGASGKVSLGLPGIDLVDAVGPNAAYALALRQDASARTNVGIVNLDSESRTFSVTAFGLTNTATFPVTVPPYSVLQVALPAGSYGDLFLAITPPASAQFWSAYGVSVDNTTGDSWESHAIQP